MRTPHTVHLTLRDTPSGAVSVHSDFKPAVGNPATPAQSLALDLLRQIPREWPVDFGDTTREAVRDPLVYISGPMTDVPQLNHPAFNLAAQALRSAGWAVFNPAENGMPPEAPWAEHMRVDIAQLVRCTHVATLEGWQSSRGAVLEVHIANRLGLQVSTLQHLITLGATRARAQEATA